MKIVTHNGPFHTDEVFAIATLLKVYPEANVVRSRDEEVINSADMMVDVGSVYSPNMMKFDHHQPEGAGEHPEGIPYASFGLVWKEYGEKIVGGAEEADELRRVLVLPIDAIDNGVAISSPIQEEVREYTIGNFVSSFEPIGGTQDDFDKAFTQAVLIISALLEREIAIARKKVSNQKEVKKIYEQSQNKKIIELPGYLMWKDVLIPTEAVFVVSPRPDNKWQAVAVPKVSRSFDRKKLFPKEWGGLREKELASLSGVDDAMFCHRGLFLAVAQSRGGALKLAEKALNA